MFALKGAILYFFGWFMLFGSTGHTTLPSDSYTPVDSISAPDDHDHSPAFLDAVFKVNQSSTHQTPSGKIYSQPSKIYQSSVVLPTYSLAYYAIGQQIVVSLTVNDLLFPFHCFT